MQRQFYAGSSYSSMRPDGSYCVFMRGSHFETSSGRVELPTGDGWKSDVRYHDHVVFNGQLVIAGQAEGGPNAGCWLKIGARDWFIVGGAHGMEMVRMSDDNRYVFVVDSNETGYWYDFETAQLAPFVTSFGVNGIRSVHGPNRTMQTGQSTMSDPSRLISKFTTLDNGLVVGQANGSGTGPSLLAVRGSDRRILEAGACNFYQANQVGNTLAIGIVKEQENACVTLFLDVSELDSLPLEPAAAPITPINKACNVGYIYQWGKYGDNPSAPCNTTILSGDDPEDTYQRVPVQCILPWTKLAGVNDGGAKLAAVWIHANSVEEIEQQVPQARQALASRGLPARPVYGYLDNRKWTRLPNPAPDWYGPQLYQDASETLDEFKANMAAMLSIFPNAPIVLFGQAFTSNSDLTANIGPLQPYFYEVMRDDPRVRGLLWFSDGRSGGMREHEDLRPTHREIVAAVQTPPIEGGNGGGGGGGNMDHNAMNTFANEWWAANNIRQRSIDIGGNANVPGTDKSYCLPLQQWAFRRIMTEAYFVKGFTWALMFWKDGFIHPGDDEATIQRKLDRVGEDAYCYLTSPTSSEWKDAIGSMGTVDASLNFLPPFAVSSPGDYARVGPAPSLEFMTTHDLPPDGELPPNPDPGPGPTTWGIEILSFETPARRSDASGCLIQFNPLCANKVPDLEAWLEGDGEPKLWFKCSDFRYNRAIAPKFVKNGRYRLMMTGKDDQGNLGEILGEHWIEVTE